MEEEGELSCSIRVRFCLLDGGRAARWNENHLINFNIMAPVFLSGTERRRRARGGKGAGALQVRSWACAGLDLVRTRG